MDGWIKLHRKTLDNPIFENAELLQMWIWILCKVSHKEREVLLGLDTIKIKKGEFITGRSQGSKELNVNPNTWYKRLKFFENQNMIELNSNNKRTIVKVINWGFYQDDEVDNYQQSNNRVTTQQQQSNTNKNEKNVKNEKNNKEIYSPAKPDGTYAELYRTIIEYLNLKANTNFKPTTKATQSKIKARLNEGHSLDDFIAVIDKKSIEWINNPNMCKFLRPETLFGEKFEGYLNQRAIENPNDFDNRAMSKTEKTYNVVANTDIPDEFFE